MTTLFIGLALGMRHGTDPDHLTAIDGLSRLRPRAANGLYFALGHGLVVTLLAAGIGQIVSDRVAFLGPWLLIFIGVVNLAKLLQKSAQPLEKVNRSIVPQPFFWGMLFAGGFETASQFSVLILAGETNPWFLGAVFTGGMILVDGIDGYLAASTQKLGSTGETNARKASHVLGILVVLFSFGLGGAELLGMDLDRFALPVGLTLFAVVVSIRFWARAGARPPLFTSVLTNSPIE
jgi:high-affinity nickel-transport protein